MTSFVTVEGRTLKHAMQIVSAVIEPRNTIPILSHVRMVCDGRSLVVHGSDLDVFASARSDVMACQGKVDFCIDAGFLKRLAATAGVMPIRFEEDRGQAKIALGERDAVYSVNTLPSGEYPDANIEKGDLIETFTDGKLAGMLDKVRGMISTEETRYYLCGVSWQSFGGRRRLVATDGHRLAACSYQGGNAALPGYIIPRKTVGLIVSHLAGKDVQVWAGGEKGLALVFTSGDITIASKLIDATYPDVQRVIPDPTTIAWKFHLKRAEAIEALRRVDIVRDGQGRAVKLHEDAGQLAVSRTMSGFGSAAVKTSVAWPHVESAAPDSFGFNANYLMDFLMHGQGDPVLHMTDGHSPFMITDADESMTRVLMPMRV